MGPKRKKTASARRRPNARTTTLAAAAALIAASGGCANQGDDAVGTRASAIDVDPAIVIRQVYGGGGNSGAAIKHDFIELFNRGSAPQSLAGWSLQYASAAGTGAFGANATAITELPDVTLAPGQSYLVQEAAGAGGTALAGADLVDATPIALSATAGKVALVRTASTLGCNGGNLPCSQPQLDAIVDLVGFGGANFFEGAAPTAAPSNTTCVLRVAGGCTDTNQNASDFATGAPELRSSASAATPCGGSAEDASTDAEVPDAGVDAGSDAGLEPGTVRIRDIQGTSHRSPLTGQTVERVPGVVTAVDTNGFYFQDEAPDTDERTSEGLFVFTSSAPTASVGDRVLVSGTVTEFRPGCASCSPSSSAYANLTVTEITSPLVTLLASGAPVPAATVIAASGRVPPLAAIAPLVGGDIELAGLALDPSQYGVDFYESLEGMLVELPDARAVSPTRTFSGGSLELAVVSGSARSSVASRGASVINAGDFNPERMILANGLGVALPSVDVGASFAGAVRAVVDYTFANYKLNVTSLPAVLPSANQKERVALPAPLSTELTVASFNVENLDPLDPAEKFANLADRIVTNLGAPDLIALEEVQDDNGATNDSLVTADVTLMTLVDAITTAGGPSYTWRQIDPVDDQDGGEPGGNIRVAILFRTDRGLAFVDRAGGTPTSANSVQATPSGPALLFSPGRLQPTSSAFASSRKPLAAELTFRGQTLFVVANHFNSKGGDQPLFGRFQPPALDSESQRSAQAAIVASFVRDLLTMDARAKVLVMGDLNDFQWSPPVATLKSAGLEDLIERLPANEQYSYVFDGNGQVLDHIMASPGLSTTASGVDVVHVNSEFVSQDSDHDPLVARFVFAAPAAPACGLPVSSADNACAAVSSAATQSLTATPFDAPVTRAITRLDRAYGVRLAQVGSSFQGALSFTPTRTASYAFHLGTPSMPLQVLDGRTVLGASCTSTRQSTCAELKAVHTYELEAGKTYELRFGPASPQSWVRVVVQREAPRVCDPVDLPGSEAWCAAAASTTSISLGVDVNSAPDIAAGVPYGMRLQPTEGNNSGHFLFAPSQSGPHVLYLGSNVPVTANDGLSVRPAACDAALPCSLLPAAYRFDLEAGRTYDFALGPTSPQRWVRALLASPAQN